MNFYEIPSIPAGNVFRAAMVSSTRGERVVNKLADEQRITPVRTPTGRILLSPTDGARVYETLVQGA